MLTTTGSIDLDQKVVLWNDFMNNHYCGDCPDVIGTPISNLFPDMPVDWFQQKVKGVLKFKGRAFSTWEQRPYLFKMRHYRPFTSAAEHMYQNTKLTFGAESPSKQSSIHHLEIPEADLGLLDEGITEQMETVMSIIETGRKLRENKQISLKHPINSLTVISENSSCLK